MPNIFAYSMLAIWPMIMLVLFKKMSPDRALIWSFLGAYMVMPNWTYLDLPLIPTLDRKTIPCVAAFLICLFTVRPRIKLFPASPLISALMIVYLLSPFVTFLTNREPIFWGPLGIPGLSIKDAIGSMLQHAIQLVPFILGFNLLGTRDARHALLRAFFFGALVYSIPMMLEVRLTPQINYWVYGMFPELFGQQVRFGGFRPVVFMGHGLVVAFFTMLAVLSTATLLTANTGAKRGGYLYGLMYLVVVLVFCRSVGALLFAMLFLPVILFATARLKGWAIFVCAAFVLSYPVLRAADLVPTDELIGYAAMIQEDRARSLEFRFINEEILLDRANVKPVAGWGQWDRNRIFDEEGRDISVTDGYWVIVIGVLGWTGYASIFGILSIPLIRLWRQRKRLAQMGHDRMTFGIAIMLAVNLLELIPNATISNLTWLFAGLLLAATLNPAQLGQSDEQPISEPTEEPPLRHVRSRRGAPRNSDEMPKTKFKRQRRTPPN